MYPSVSPLGCVVCLHKGLLPGVQLLKVSSAGTLEQPGCCGWEKQTVQSFKSISVSS